jgi:hypothetical protein|tara:strand:- start:264 stop:566 length:303 start_codon:yes stop_codon:yes gene_type:complete
MGAAPAAAIAKSSAVKDVDSQEWSLPTGELKVNPSARPPTLDGMPFPGEFIFPLNIVALPTEAMLLLCCRSLLIFASVLYFQVVTTAAVTCVDSKGAHQN